MAVRRWQIHPDVMHPTLGVPVLSHTTFIEGVADGVAMMQRAGGVLSVVAERINSDLPGEMVTILAVCEWKDRTDAKPQPEQVTQLSPQMVEEQPTPDDVAVSQIAALQAAAEEFGLVLATPEEPQEGVYAAEPLPAQAAPPARSVQSSTPDPVPPAPAAEPDDGLDKSELPDEDNSSIPTNMR